MTLLTSLIAFIIAVGLLVTVHELGHYWVARWSGVKILRFSIGFGKPIWMRKRGPDQTEWAIGSLPLGGYVRMLDVQDEEFRHEDLPRTFSRQNVWKRIAIVLAGPAANFLLAWLIYWVLLVVGTPDLRPLVAAPVAGTPAAMAGLREGDLVLSVDGEAVQTWNELRFRLLRKAVDGGEVALATEDASGAKGRTVLSLASLTKDDLDRDFFNKLGLAFYRIPQAPILGRVEAGGVADKAGLRVGDRVRSINGQPISRWEDMARTIAARPGQVLNLIVERHGQSLEVAVTPAAVQVDKNTNVGRIGVAAPPVDPALLERLTTTVRSDPFSALGGAVGKVWDMSAFSLSMMGKMVTGQLSWKHLSGPISIADYAGQSVRQGPLVYLGFLALISVSIGVLNLLPVPVLDGGQLVYYLVEVFKGSPVPQRIIEAGQQVGLVLLLGLTAFAFYNDIHRLLAG